MTLKECYILLGVTQNATLEEVKRGYRKRAFEWHPDLNPQLGDAGRRFQQLNEAYVILTKLIAARETRDERLRAEHNARAAKKSAAQETRSSASHKGTAPHEDAPGQTAEDAQAQTDKARTAEKEATRAQTEAAAEPRTEASGSTAGETAGQHTGSSSAGQGTGQGATASDGAERRSAADSAGEKVYAEQQEVLRDILNDPFARRVFEDIYSAIRQKGHEQPKPPPSGSPPPQPPKRGLFGFGGSKPSPKSGVAAGQPAPKRGEDFWGSVLGLGGGRTKTDVSKGVGGAVKGWLRGQIDEEQTFSFPATKLFPGARIRLQIRRGLSDEVTVLEVTLPPDFVTGKPIRLKGMGKKVGGWQGDLYLTLLAR